MSKQKIVIYARYSSDKQTEQSIDGQLRECYSYAERNNYAVVGEYIDRALTGTTDKRPEFLRMIEDSKKQIFNYILVYQLDRFARNRYDSAIYKSKLTKNGVRVISARENITDDASGVLVEGMLESMTEYYSKELSQKTKRGMKESILKGNWTGGYIPYGYDVVDKKLVINEKEAQIVKKIFESVLQNIKFKTIVKKLNYLGYRTKTNKSFTENYISRLLKNRKYIGELSQTYKSEEKIPQIIDEDTFNLVNNKLKAFRGKNARAKAEEPYYLSGKLYCGCCNELMIADSGTNHAGVVYKYYKCSKRKKRTGIWKKSTIRKEYLEEKIIDKTITDILKPEIIEEIALNVTNNFNKALQENLEVKSMEKQINAVSKKIENIMAAIEQGIITVTTKEKLMQLESEKTDLETKLNSILNKEVKPLTISEVRGF